ncbi:MAG TPA: type II secretion system protein [Candidatus Paceibacterota bacterium]|nr:type II secretion system protein [Candidatus Paceibacterota bacterium]
MDSRNAEKNTMQQKGVTFIELVVVISIFSIIAGTLLVNFSRFGRNVTIQNLAQDIALQINEVQKEAISGRTNELIADCNRIDSDCSPRYGIYLTARDVGNTPNLGSYAPLGAGKSLLKFIDYIGGEYNNKLDNGWSPCGAGVNTECIDNISLGQGNYISEICVGEDADCTTDISNSLGVNIVFKRPLPDAIITTDDDRVWKYVRITVTSPNVDTPSRDIVVTSLGQISIQAHP